MDGTFAGVGCAGRSDEFTNKTTIQSYVRFGVRLEFSHSQTWGQAAGALQLGRPDLQSVLEDYPELANRLQSHAQERLVRSINDAAARKAAAPISEPSPGGASASSSSGLSTRFATNVGGGADGGGRGIGGWFGLS